MSTRSTSTAATSNDIIRKPRALELDFVRGIAILMVMGYHFEQAPKALHPILYWLQEPFKLCGATGVDMFFVLSGFLVGGLLLKEYLQTQRVNSTKFILRRGLKIWPAYYFYIFFQMVTHKHPLSTFAVQNLVHLQNYLGSSLGHTWTLAVEEHFYLLLTFALAWMTSRQWPIERILKVFLCVIPAVIAIRCLTVYEGWPGAGQYTHNRLDALMMGVVLAVLFHFYPEIFDRISDKKWLLAGTAAAAVIFCCLFQSHKVEFTVGFTIMYVGYAALLLLVYRHSGRVKNWAPYRWTASIGLYSYGIYLWHNAGRQPMLAFASHLPESVKWPVTTIGQVLIGIVLGVLSTRLVEWPFLRLRDKLFPSRVALQLELEVKAMAQVQTAPEQQSIDEKLIDENRRALVP